MKQLYFWGAGHYGIQAFKAMERYDDDDDELVAFIDEKKQGIVLEIPIVSPHDIVDWNDITVVITFADVASAESVCEDLLHKGCRKIYYYLRKENIYSTAGGFLENECIDIGQMKDDSLLYCEMHVADCCNLNCRGCTHFSALYKKQFPEIEKRLEDVKKLCSVFTGGVKIFNLLGGEPLLNPQINEYIERCRAILKDSQIWLTTNGLMLLRMPDSFFQKLYDNKILCSISVYKPVQKIISDIEKKLCAYKVEYNIRAFDIKQNFSMPLSSTKDGSYPHKCLSNGCVNICDGKIARCPQLMFIGQLNKTFGLNYPEEGIYNLDYDMDVKDLRKHLRETVPLCEYCIDKTIPWSTCQNPPAKSDFIC